MKPASSSVVMLSIGLSFLHRHSFAGPAAGDNKDCWQWPAGVASAAVREASLRARKSGPRNFACLRQQAAVWPSHGW
jgi:hypothetical protein